MCVCVCVGGWVCSEMGRMTKFRVHCQHLRFGQCFTTNLRGGGEGRVILFTCTLCASCFLTLTLDYATSSLYNAVMYV